jgi:flagellar basal body-associated protein FliL
MPVGAGSGVPLLIGIVVVALTAAGIGFFLFERSKERTWMQQEEQRAAEREKVKRKPAVSDGQQPAKR